MTSSAKTPRTLRERLDEYLVMRRALGFQLNDVERQVGSFCSWLEAGGQTKTFTIDEAVTWARLNPDAHPSWWATRLSLVRRFAAYLNANGVDVPVIPGGLLPARKPRAVPFIYSQDDCTGKGRRQRITPLTRATLSATTAYLTERVARPGTALFCGPRGQHLSRDALEHRLAKHIAGRRRPGQPGAAGRAGIR
jgi:site-specific recombinase XerC